MKAVFSASALVLLFVASTFAYTTFAQSASCHQYDKRDAVPQGFAAAYNPVTSAKELLMDITCHRDNRNAVIEIGSGDPLMYIYEGGYYEKNGQWILNESMYEGSDRVVDSAGNSLPWYKGTASASLDNDSATLDEEHYVLAYMCQWVQPSGTSGQWKCGCGNPNCPDSQSTWSLQTYKYPAATTGITPPPSSSSNPGNSNSTQAETVTVDVRSKNFEFDVTNINVNEGDTVVINLTNEEGVHDWKIDEFNAQTSTLDSEGDTDSISFVASKKGTFEFYCSIPGHRQLGMVGTLTVN